MHAPGGAYSAYWKSLSPRARRRNLAVLRRVHFLIVLGRAGASSSTVLCPSEVGQMYRQINRAETTKLLFSLVVLEG